MKKNKTKRMKKTKRNWFYKLWLLLEILHYRKELNKCEGDSPAYFYIAREYRELVEELKNIK